MKLLLLSHSPVSSAWPSLLHVTPHLHVTRFWTTWHQTGAVTEVLSPFTNSEGVLRKRPIIKYPQLSLHKPCLSSLLHSENLSCAARRSKHMPTRTCHLHCCISTSRGPHPQIPEHLAMHLRRQVTALHLSHPRLLQTGKRWCT